ncbi:MAG: esterase [Clostridiales bacterium]|nr:esterase [Clostridiales bacterium]
MNVIELNEIKITLFGDSDRLVLLHTSADEAAAIYALTKPDYTLAAIEGIDWNSDLSPWAVKGVFKSAGDFSGGADEYLAHLRYEIMPAIHADEYCERYLAGYSLAGLFALYTATKADDFDGIASVSGSVWYDGFVEYFRKSAVHTKSVWLSLGDAEGKSRNPRLAAVDSCTEAVYARLRELKLDCTYVRHIGGHFNEPEHRVADAINWLLSIERN